MSNLITARKNYIPPSYIRAAAADKHANPWNYADDISTVSLWMNSDASRGGLFNMTKAANPLSKANIGSTLSGVTSVLGPVASKLISDGYSAGTGFNTVMSTVLSLNTGNPVFDTIKNVAATAIQGLGNRAFGTKRNETNINALNANKAQARTAGTTLGSASTTNDLLASSGQMTGGTGFKTTDLVKGGWFAKGKARKQGLGMLNQETAALAYLNHGLQTGANNVDTKQDSMVMRNFAALGGPLMGVDPSTAIGYQLYTDKYVRDNNRSVPNMFAGTPLNLFETGGPKKSREQKDAEDNIDNLIWYLDQRIKYPYGRKKTKFEKFLNNDLDISERTTEPWFGDANTPTIFSYPISSPSPEEKLQNAINNTRKLVNSIGTGTRKVVNRGEPYIPHMTFALGGDIQTHGADWDTGVNHVNAGGTHEENPYDGVQMGVDQLNVPNLVEEGEVIYKDYVFSNRLDIPKYDRKDTSREAKALRKYSGKTFADTAKKIEKRMGADERTDAITKAGLDVELQLLAQVLEKERQKQQLLGMQDAIDNMTPEEFAMLQLQMQAQQDAEALQEAMAQQQQMIPLGMEQMAPPEEMMSAYGGPIYALGGLLDGWEPTENILSTEPILPNVYALGGQEDRDLEWYNNLPDDIKWYVDTFGLTDQDALNAFTRSGFYNLLSTAREDTGLDGNIYDAYNRLPEAVTSMLRNIEGIDNNTTFIDITPELWRLTYRKYIEDAKAFNDKYPTIPYDLRFTEGSKNLMKEYDTQRQKEAEVKAKEAVKQEEKLRKQEEKAKTREEKERLRAERLALKAERLEAERLAEEAKKAQKETLKQEKKELKNQTALDQKFSNWWEKNISKNLIKIDTALNRTTDFGKIYKSITGEDSGPTDSVEVYDALKSLYKENPSLFKDYDLENYRFTDLPMEDTAASNTSFEQLEESPITAEDILNEVDLEALQLSQEDARRALDLIMGVTDEPAANTLLEVTTDASNEEPSKEDKNSLDYKLRKSLERLYRKNTKNFDYDELNGHAKAAFEDDLRKVKENPELLKEDANRELNISGYKGNKSKMEFNQYATDKARDAYLGSPVTLDDNGRIAIQYNNEGTIPQALSFIQNGLTYDGKNWKDALGNIVNNPYSKEYGFTDVKRNWNNWGYIDKDGNWHKVDAPVASTSGNTDYRFTPSAEWAKDLGDAKSYEQLEEYLNNYADFIEALNKGDKDALKRLYVLGEATKSNNPEDRKGKNRYFKEGVDPNNLKKEDVIGYDPNHPEYGIFGNTYFTNQFGIEDIASKGKSFAYDKDGSLIKVGGEAWNNLSDELKKAYTQIEGPLTREHLMNNLKWAINQYPENWDPDVKDLYLQGVNDNIWGPHHLMANRGTTRYALVDELGNYIKDGDNIRYLDYNPDATYNFYKKDGTNVTPIESLMIDGINVDTIGVLGGTVDNHIGVRRNPDGTWLSYRLTPEQAAKLKQREIVSTDERYSTLPQFEEAVGGYTLNPHYYELDDDAYKSLGFNDLGYAMNGLDKPDPFPRAPWWPYLAGAGLLLASLGYNMLSPKDYSNADAMIKAAKEAGNFTPVEFKPIGNYLTYRPMDIWAELNRMNAAARATDRAIMNSSSPYSSKVAGLLASGYNEQLGSGELFKKSLEYNDALNKQVAEFNKDTDKFNSEGLLKRDMANQDAATRARGFTLEGLKSGYAMRQAIDDARSNAISAGISGLANLAYNYAANKYNQDLMGWGMRHNSWGPGIYYEEDAPKKTVSTPTYVSSGARGNTTAKGGKLKVRRKKGLGF